MNQETGEHPQLKNDQWSAEHTLRNADVDDGCNFKQWRPLAWIFVIKLDPAIIKTNLFGMKCSINAEDNNF